jgi:prevent-host-death family protein
MRRRWQLQEAKARFSEFLEATLKEGPQVVTRRGVDAAILVRMEDWHRFEQAARPTLKELLMAREPRTELLVPPRGRRRRRAPVSLG